MISSNNRSLFLNVSEYGCNNYGAFMRSSSSKRSVSDDNNRSLSEAAAAFTSCIKNMSIPQVRRNMQFIRNLWSNHSVESIFYPSTVLPNSNHNNTFTIPTTQQHTSGSAAAAAAAGNNIPSVASEEFKPSPPKKRKRKNNDVNSSSSSSDDNNDGDFCMTNEIKRIDPLYNLTIEEFAYFQVQGIHIKRRIKRTRV